MKLFAGSVSRLKIVFDRNNPSEKRIWSAWELFCIWASWGTLILSFALVAAQYQGMNIQPWLLKWLFPILVSGMIGYLTNYIAIEMLFKPYEPIKWLPFWKQGLIPRNKGKIAEQIAVTVETNLIRPDEIANLICNKATLAINDRQTRENICGFIHNQVLTHEDKIISYIYPQVEKLALNEFEQTISKENLYAVVDRLIIPYLQDDKTCDKISRAILEAFHANTDRFSNQVTPLIQKEVANYLNNLEVSVPLMGKVPVGKIFSICDISQGIAKNLVEQKTLEKLFSEWLQNEDTASLLKKELSHGVEYIRNSFNSTELDEEIQKALEKFRKKGKAFLKIMLASKRDELDLYLQKPDLWNWINDFVPQLVPIFEKNLREYAIPYIINNFDVKGIVKAKVDAMNVREFHDLVASATEEHLSAIQVLGYILGVLVGALSVIVNLR